MNVRKLLLIFRLLNHNDPIPNIKLNIKNRYKQLTKPVIRLFQNTESIDEITSSLSKYLIEKNQEKIDSIDSAILTFIVNLVSKHGETLYNDQIWIELKTKYPNGEIQDKPYSWYIEGYGSVSKNSITKTCETKFGAKLHRDPGSGRGLIFNQKTLNKLVENYSIIEGIKIIEKKEVHDTYDTNDTSTEYPDKNSNDNLTKTVDNMTEITQDQEKLIPQNDNVITKNDNDIEIKSNGYSQKVSYPSYVSYNNPLISESDLSIGGQYDPEIINNIHRVHPNSDRWFCYNCTLRDDKWGMIRHLCKHNKNFKENRGKMTK